jgi:hypothetical protein
MPKTDNPTDIDGVRSASKALLFAVEINCDNPFGIVSHPFTNNIFAMDDEHKIVNLTDADTCLQWKKNVAEAIDKASLNHIYIMLNKPWKITWLKYVEQYMSDSDFASYLSDAYVSEEMPNLNPNVPVKELIKWFKRADKHYLMDQVEYDAWQQLPDVVELYRGISHGTEDGISWTTEFATAKWFAERFATDEHKARIYKVIANKKDCLCYFASRGEYEIILDVNAVKNKIEQIV